MSSTHFRGHSFPWRGPPLRKKDDCADATDRVSPLSTAHSIICAHLLCTRFGSSDNIIMYANTRHSDGSFPLHKYANFKQYPTTNGGFFLPLFRTRYSEFWIHVIIQYIIRPSCLWLMWLSRMSGVTFPNTHTYNTHGPKNNKLIHI